MDATVIAIVSGKGGTGKSTTAVFLGGALAESSMKRKNKGVLLIELDSGLRSVDIIAGVGSQTIFDIGDVIAGRCEARKAIAESPNYKGLHVISAPASAQALSAEQLTEVIKQLSKDFDYILLDSPAGVGTGFEAAVSVAHRVLLVLTPDPVALRDGRQVANHVYKQTDKIRLIFNRVNEEKIFKEAVIGDLDEAIDAVGVQLIGVVPESRAISNAAANGSVLPKNSIETKVYAALAKRLRGIEVPLVFPKL